MIKIPVSRTTFRGNRSISGASFSMVNLPGTIVSAQWLSENLSNVRVLDGSWYLPSAQRNPDEEFFKERIPNARRFDIDRIADKSSDLPHMFPPLKLLADLARTELGFNSKTPIVVYDGAGVFSAPRVWYTLKLFGVEQVGVLQGGFPEWKKSGLEIESGPVKPMEIEEASQNFSLRETGIASKEKLLENLSKKNCIVLDARPKPRFDGIVPEPRPGLALGRIPDSINIPFDIMSEGGAGGPIKSPEKLRNIFEEVCGPRIWTDPVVTTCGSGVTASVVALGLHLSGKPLDDISIYDGSWAEWGNPENRLPIEK